MEPEAKRRKTLAVAGRRVQIKGLTSEAGKKLNGLSATVRREEDGGRLTVEVDAGESKALKMENLTLARHICPGVRVEMHGLRSAALLALNGKTGVVTSSRDEATMRYWVDVPNCGTRALKAENLKVSADPVWGLQLMAGAQAILGRRPTQEDRNVQVTDLHKVGAALHYAVEHLPRPCAMFAVYDGHMGATCSDYIAKNMHAKLLPRLAGEVDLHPAHIKELLRSSFLELDDNFLTQHDCPDGSTAIVALILGTDLYVANVGDSCGVLCDAKGVDLSLVFPDHKPGSDAERKRITDAGGVIVELGGCFRVAHDRFEERTEEYERQVNSGDKGELEMPIALAVSRAFGDRDFKFCVEGEKRVDLVSCNADVEHVELQPGHHRALILMSDGVTDGVTGVMTLDEVAKKVVTLDGQPKAASGAVCTESLQRGSEDNVTVVTVFLKWGKL